MTRICVFTNTGVYFFARSLHGHFLASTLAFWAPHDCVRAPLLRREKYCSTPPQATCPPKAKENPGVLNGVSLQVLRLVLVRDDFDHGQPDRSRL